MSTSRTRLEWFKMFPEPWRSQAIKNYVEDYDGCNGQSLFDNAADALHAGFDWEKTPQNQGFDHWAKFHDVLWRNEITLTVPKEVKVETLEQAARKYAENMLDNDPIRVLSFIQGVTWQATQPTLDYKVIVREFKQSVNAEELATTAFPYTNEGDLEDTIDSAKRRIWISGFQKSIELLELFIESKSQKNEHE